MGSVCSTPHGQAPAGERRVWPTQSWRVCPIAAGMTLSEEEDDEAEHYA